MGESIEKQIKNLSPGMKIAGAVILCLFVLMLFREKKPEPLLNAKVNFNAEGLTITNVDGFDWSNINVKVNSQYELHLERLRAGASLSLDPTSLSRKDGLRFQPHLVKVKDVILSADMPEGVRRHYIGEWH